LVQEYLVVLGAYGDRDTGEMLENNFPALFVQEGRIYRQEYHQLFRECCDLFVRIPLLLHDP
jgi:hypothetical protein